MNTACHIVEGLLMTKLGKGERTKVELLAAVIDQVSFFLFSGKVSFGELNKE